MSFTQARADLVAVLTPVMPARRVFAYPPAGAAPVAPAIYVATYVWDWSDDFTVSATFAVRVVADGANTAAHAKLDELNDAVRAAVARSSRFYPNGGTYEPFDVDAVVALPAYTHNVAVEIDAVSWCPPDAAPPVPVTLNGVPQ